LVILLGPGQSGDAPIFVPVLAAIRVPCLGPGCPRTRPDAVLADQQGHRKRRGSRGGRPVSYDGNLYKGRNVVERAFSLLNNGEDWQPGKTSTP